MNSIFPHRELITRRATVCAVWANPRRVALAWLANVWQAQNYSGLPSPTARRLNARFLCQVISLALAIIVFARTAISAQEPGSRTRAEQFVLRNILSGNEADLTELSSKPEDRIVGHEFLETLLTGGYGRSDSHIRAIKIENAIIDGRLDIASGSIPYAVWLTNCNFNDGVDFSGARLAGDLSLQNSTFGPIPAASQNSLPQSADNTALFIGMYVNGSMILDGATLYIPLDFTYAQISGQFLFDSVDFRSNGFADFNGLKTGAPA